MSVEEAAGFAMAPSEDDMAEPIEPHPDQALRNGHYAAAWSKVPGTQLALISAPRISETDRLAFLRTCFTGWWGGKATA